MRRVFSALDTLKQLASDTAQKRGGQRCGRYAPSPTGPQHLGNLRTALLAWLHARLTGSVFILRMEDLDTPRVKPGSAEQIIYDLKWLGLDWNEGPDIGGQTPSYNQAERNEIYDAALSALQERNRVFDCTCSRRDIAQAASAPHGGSGNIYPGSCRGKRPLTDSKKSSSKRFIADGIQTTFEDGLAGSQSQNLQKEVGDFVIKRADGLYAYQLAVAIDDALMGVTDVVRGVDLLDSTHRQIALLNALDLSVPDYWHVPLMFDYEGRRLSKRANDESLDDWRERGSKPEDVVGFLAASVGWIEAGVSLSVGELLGVVSGASLNRDLAVILG